MAGLLERAFGGPDESRLVAALRREGGPLLALVASESDRVVGQVLFSRLRLERPSGDPGPAVETAALAPLAVEPARQGRGIGAALARAGLEACRRAAVEAVFVLGEPAYYARFGFSAATARPFASPFPAEVFMALALVPGVLDAPNWPRGGRVRYAAAFGLGPDWTA